MTLQERLRDEAMIADEHQYYNHARSLVQAADALDARERALAEIREVWAGAECGEPVHAQEAYAIHLCKQMYQIACDALAGKVPTLDAQAARIKELEGALRDVLDTRKREARAFNLADAATPNDVTSSVPAPEINAYARACAESSNAEKRARAALREER